MRAAPEPRPVGEVEFERLFTEFHYTAFRLETLQHYAVGYEEESLRRFLDEGESGFSTAQREWAREVREGRERGRSYRRVHVVAEPLSDYLRFECACAYRLSVRAGEDVRILTAAEGGWPEGLPRWDYWLFDSHRLLRMNYAPDGTMLTPELVADPEQVVAANVWRDRALHHAVPFTEYEARFDAAMRPR